MFIETIDAETYERERAICDAAAEYARETMGKRGKRCNYLTAEEAAAPVYAACNNAMRGRVEQYEILRDLPETIVAYIGKPDGYTNYRGCLPYPVITWTGDKLGAAYETARWTIESHISRYMHQYRATIGGREYTGRGQGEGMFIALRETAESKRRRALQAA